MSQRLPWKQNLFYHCKISAASSPKELYISQTIFSLRHNHLICRLSSNCLISQDCSLASFLIKSSKLDVNLNLSPYAPDLCLWHIHLMASPWSALSGLFLSRYYQEASSWSQHPQTCQLDPIPNALAVDCLDTLLPSFTALINSSLSSGVFPHVFKTALVTPLLKSPPLARTN